MSDEKESVVYNHETELCVYLRNGSQVIFDSDHGSSAEIIELCNRIRRADFCDVCFEFESGSVAVLRVAEVIAVSLKV